VATVGVIVEALVVDAVAKVVDAVGKVVDAVGKVVDAEAKVVDAVVEAALVSVEVLVTQTTLEAQSQTLRAGLNNVPPGHVSITLDVVPQFKNFWQSYGYGNIPILPPHVAEPLLAKVVDKVEAVADDERVAIDESVDKIDERVDDKVG
jgi:hypothetical protein